MNVKAFASVAMIAFSSVAASASTAGPAELTGPAFAELELGNFTLTRTFDVTGEAGFSPYVLIAQDFKLLLPPVSFNAVSVYNAARARTSFASWSGNHFTFSDLEAGTYSLHTEGLEQGGNFLAAHCTVTLVPEPEAFAMLLAGLCLMGALARRRTKISRT